MLARRIGFRSDRRLSASLGLRSRLAGTAAAQQRLGRRRGARCSRRCRVFDLDALADVERRRTAQCAELRAGAGGGSENVRSSARTRMLLAVSGLLAGSDRRSGRLRGGLCSDGRGWLRDDRCRRLCAAGAAGLRRELECRVLGRVRRALVGAALSGTTFAFKTPVAVVFAIAASAAGVSDGGSQVNSSRPSVGPTPAFDAAPGSQLSLPLSRRRLGFPGQLDDFGVGRRGRLGCGAALASRPSRERRASAEQQQASAVRRQACGCTAAGLG